jgi:hypothetical protein
MGADVIGNAAREAIKDTQDKLAAAQHDTTHNTSD